MAHNIEYNAQRDNYSFYSRKEKAWHGLGQILDEDLNPEEILRIANMDYQVSLAKLYANVIPIGTVRTEPITNLDGTTTFRCFDEENNFTDVSKRVAPITTNFATFRSDTQEVLGVVGSRYEIVQNDVAMDFIYQVCKNSKLRFKNDVKIETAGVLGKGERIFATAKLPNYNVVKDEYEKYIVFTSSHDGSGSITAMFTDVRVVCNNTLNAAINRCENKVLFKHTKNVLDNLNRGAEMMNKSLIYTNQIIPLLEESIKISINDNDIEDFICDMLFNDAQINHIKSQGGIKLTTQDEIISTRKLNQYMTIRNFVEQGVGQDTDRGSLYWLYNGITTYVNNGIDYKSNLDKFDSIMSGSSFKLSQKAFNRMSSIVKTA